MYTILREIYAQCNQMHNLVRTVFSIHPIRTVYRFDSVALDLELASARFR